MNASEIMTMIRCKRDRLLWWIIRSPRQIKWKILSKLKLDNGSLYHLTDYLGPYSLKDFLHSVNTEADDVHQVESDETAQSPSWVLHSLTEAGRPGQGFVGDVLVTKSWPATCWSLRRRGRSSPSSWARNIRQVSTEHVSVARDASCKEE